jgi:hypothetical protein
VIGPVLSSACSPTPPMMRRGVVLQLSVCVQFVEHCDSRNGAYGQITGCWFTSAMWTGNAAQYGTASSARALSATSSLRRPLA